MGFGQILGVDDFERYVIKFNGLITLYSIYLKQQAGEDDLDLPYFTDTLDTLTEKFDVVVHNLEHEVNCYNYRFVKRQELLFSNEFPELSFENFEQVKELGEKLKSGEFTENDLLKVNELTKNWRKQVKETIPVYLKTHNIPMPFEEEKSKG